MEQRIIDLETKLAYAERTIEELSGELYAYTLKADRLEREFNTLKEQIQSLGEHRQTVRLEDEVPPHY